MATFLKIQFKDIRRFGLKLWSAKKLTKKQKEIYLKKSRKKVYKQSFFCRKLLQEKKFALFYGKLNHQSLKKRLHNIKGDRLKNLFLILEKRLDILCFRMKFFSTIGAARQMIVHRKILLNGQPAGFSQINVKIGDIISIDSSVFPQIISSVRNYMKLLASLLTKQNMSSHESSLKKIYTKSSIIKKNRIFFNNLFFKKKLLKNSVLLTKDYFNNSNLNNILIKKQLWLHVKNIKQKTCEEQKITLIKKNINNVVKLEKTNFKFSRLNSYKIPHVEINYATLTAILLPYQSNFGFCPNFPESLSYITIKNKNF